MNAEPLTTVFEVRYDDDESYYVVARFSRKADAETLRDRLLAAHTAADGDGCHFEESWQVHEFTVDSVSPDIALPADLFDNSRAYDDHHAEVNIDRFPLEVR